MLLRRYISAIPVLLLTLLPCLYCVYFQMHQYSIRHEMEEKLENAQLHTIYVEKASFSWFKKNKEIKVDGRMFDVKSIRLENDHYVITGLFDDEETALHRQLEKMQSDPRQGTDAKQILKLLTQQVFVPAPDTNWNGQTNAIFNHHFHRYTECLVAFDPGVTSPPPKV